MDWSELYLFTLIFMRCSGFVLMNPILSRSNLPTLVRAGMIMVFSIFLFGLADQTPAVPATVLEFGLRLLLELGVGFVLGFVMQLFFMVVGVGGEIIDAQMGLNMAQVYDSSSQVNMTVTAALLNVLMILTFFAENGHYTMLRIFESSQRIVPYGQVVFGKEVASGVTEVFLACMLLAVKLSLPILAAEMLGCSRFRAYVQVVLPNIVSGILVSSLLAQSIVFGDFVLANNIAGTNYQNIQVFLQANMARSSGLSSAIVVIIVVVVAAVTAIVLKLQRSSQNR